MITMVGIMNNEPDGYGEIGSGDDGEQIAVGFGKHHASMYTGSLVGKGAEVFAVMGYVIANMKPRRMGAARDGSTWRMVVEMNPKLLAFILGEEEETITQAIEVLCAPDPDSRTKDEDGRRLVKVGQFDYVVVNGRKYRGGRDPQIRREQNRESQARFREKKKIQKATGGGAPLPGETDYVRRFGDGEVDKDGVPIVKAPPGPKSFKDVLPAVTVHPTALGNGQSAPSAPA